MNTPTQSGRPAPAEGRKARAARLPYRAPALVAYGNLRGLTLGGTGSLGDSGGTKMVMVFFTHGYRELP